MWAIMAVTLHMLAGPDAWAVTQAGVFKDKDACQAAIAKAVPAELSDKDKTHYEKGELGYMCVKVIEG